MYYYLFLFSLLSYDESTSSNFMTHSHIHGDMEDGRKKSHLRPTYHLLPMAYYYFYLLIISLFVIYISYDACWRIEDGTYHEVWLYAHNTHKLSLLIYDEYPSFFFSTVLKYAAA